MLINLAEIVGFDWDDGNRRKSVDKHAVSREESEQVFFDPSVILAVDIAHSVSEERFHAFGATANGRLLQVSFTLRGSKALIRVISARDMSSKERKSYAQEGKENPQIPQ